MTDDILPPTGARVILHSDGGPECTDPVLSGTEEGPGIPQECSMPWFPAQNGGNESRFRAPKAPQFVSSILS